MKLLLDSHVLLWWHQGDGRLVEAARSAIKNRSNDVWVSVATAWEIGVKQAARRLALRESVADLISDYEFEPLAISLPHAVLASSLPRHHGDPFDRMLVAQARLEDMTIVTHDARIVAYGVPVLRT